MFLKRAKSASERHVRTLNVFATLGRLTLWLSKATADGSCSC